MSVNRQQSNANTGSPKTSLLTVTLYGLAAFAILAVSWQGRTYINPDGISYLDIARQMLKGNPSAYFHPYWSPLFPALLAVVIKLVSPSPPSILLLAHAVIAGAALAALASFGFFTREWHALLTSKTGNQTTTQSPTAILYGLSLFLFATIKFIGTNILTPDILATAIVFAIAALACRLAAGRGRTRSAIALGLLLALGYFTKAALFPLGLLLLVLLAFFWYMNRARLIQVILATMVFFALVTPYIAILSARQHKLTFGESGKLNYAWSVLHNAPMYAGWTGGSESSGYPAHPLKVLGKNPTVLEFDHTTPGTFPLWYNPAYFYQGLKIHFDLQKQVRQLQRVPEQIIVPVRRSGLPILLVFLIFAVLARKQLPGVRLAAPWLLLWAMGAYCMYGLVVIHPRYVAPFFILITYVVTEELLTRLPLSTVRLADISVTVAASLLLLDLVYLHTIRKPPVPAQNNGTIQQQLARNLKSMGVAPKDKIAILGNPFIPWFAFQDHLRVVATIGFRNGSETGDAAAFWRMNRKAQSKLENQLAQLGISAIVSTVPCHSTAGTHWHDVDDDQDCALLLRPQTVPSSSQPNT